ncbi:gp53-like domain-containing protein [Agrobacterium sp. 22-226-1]
MDRINGADTIDIGGGRRGFRDENLVAGAAGTEVTALFLNMVQEEILKVITEAGLAPSEGDWTQLWQALQIHGLSADSRSRRWLSVISMTLSSAPGAPSAGDTYLIPTGATGIWATHVGEIAQWTGSAWSYLTPPDGHGISLPDGRVFERIAGTYVEKLALDAQSGKWTYAVAGGTANALTAVLSPVPAALTEGMTIRLKIATTNTGAVTLNVGLGAVSVVSTLGAALIAGELQAGTIREFIWTGAAWRLRALGVTDFPMVKSGIGYQKLPSGFILQWGTYVTTSNPAQTITFPIAFPTGILTCVASQGNAGDANWGAGIPDVSAPQNSTWTASQVRIYTLRWNATSKSWEGQNGLGVNWIAIGY